MQLVVLSYHSTSDLFEKYKGIEYGLKCWKCGKLGYMRSRYAQRYTIVQ